MIVCYSDGALKDPRSKFLNGDRVFEIKVPGGGGAGGGGAGGHCFHISMALPPIFDWALRN